MLFKLGCLFLIAIVAHDCEALYGAGTNVVELTDSNFDRLVVKSDEVWVVEFFAPWCGHCQQLVPEYKKLATALKGVAKVGALNADEHKSIGGQFGVKGFPTIKIFGGNKRKPDDYNGERTALAMAKAAVEAAKRKVTEALGGGSGGDEQGDSGGDDVVTLTDDNFDRLVMNNKDNTMWLVEFYAPWCGHCKNLAPHWAKAASKLKGTPGVKLGALDATVHSSTAARYGIQGYPTIKWFTDGGKTVVDFDGGRTESDIVSWVQDRVITSIPPPELVQITGESVFASECENKPLCVVAVLPHILDCQASCRDNYLKMLTRMGDKYKQKMWGWLWTEGGAQFSLEDSLDIGGFGYPAMAVVNVKKMKYSLFRGSFSKDGVDEFLRDLSYGRGNTAPVKGGALPKIVKTDAWDGKDGELPQEEDIDLTDVDLDKDEL